MEKEGYIARCVDTARRVWLRVVCLQILHVAGTAALLIGVVLAVVAISASPETMWWLVAALPVLVIAGMLVESAILAASAAVAVRDDSFVKSLKFGYEGAVKFTLTALAVAGIVLAGLILLIIPGLILAARLIFFPFVFVENGGRSVRRTIRESFEITRIKGDGFWVALGVLALHIFVGSIIPVYSEGSNAPYVLTMALTVAVVVPILIAASYAAYTKVRKKGGSKKNSA